jgi:glutamyl-tRNA synthetase
LSKLRVRFAPSPTGFLHVGGLRTALYNYLLAKKYNGAFILRIEDTDRNRFVPGAVENLIRTLKWAGLAYDEGPGVGGEKGPYVQSERTELYQKCARQLVGAGNAYYDFSGQEEDESHGEAIGENEGSPRVTRRGGVFAAEEVSRRLEAGEPAAIRMRVPEGQTISFEDVIRGHVEFSSDLVNDQVLLKSDGYPTYHLANVVDDHSMGVTHVIRGEEWLSSTPKHVLLYDYFGWERPVFAHLPLLLNPDRTKLSKRQGDVAVEDYQRKGYLADALVNFIALLGWNPGDEREIFGLHELAQEFSLERVGKAGAVFNLEKLNSVNKQYIKTKSDAELVVLARPFLAESGILVENDNYLQAVIRLTKERVTTLRDFAMAADFFFADPVAYDEESVKKSWKAESPGYLADALNALRTLSGFSAPDIELQIRATAGNLGIGTGKLIHPIRLVITGRSTGPGLFELMEVLGKDSCVRRMERALQILV